MTALLASLLTSTFALAGDDATGSVTDGTAAGEAASKSRSGHRARGADRREDRADRKEDRRDRAEDRADRREDRADRAEDRREHHAEAKHRVPAHHHAAPSHAEPRRYTSHHRHHPSWYATHAWRPGYPRYWFHGVFVHAPAPVAMGGPEKAAAPKRTIDHAGDFAIGLRGGSYLSGYKDGGTFGDAGLGLAARYRPIDALGFEVAWTYHDQMWARGTERIEQPFSGTVQLFAFPWTRVNPYALAGVTVTQRNIQDDLGFGQLYQTNRTLWGPTGGVGIEFGLTKDVSLNFDARWTGYLNKPVDDPALAGAFQGNMGLNVYF